MPRSYAFEPETASLVVSGPASGLSLGTRTAPPGPHPERRHYAHALSAGDARLATIYSDVDEPWGLEWGGGALPSVAPAWLGSPARQGLIRWLEERGLALAPGDEALLAALPPDRYALRPLGPFLRSPTLYLRDGAVRERGDDTALVVATEIEGEELDTFVTVEVATRPGAGFGQLLLGVALMDYPFDQPDRAHLLLLGLGEGRGQPVALVPESGALVVPCSATAAGAGAPARAAVQVAEDWVDRKREAVLQALEDA